ncbi:helix-turn-helix domain-containing protein [Adhaeribacter pallidiroseus]|uniref:HTH araC/xylS-type domain-containing protein n=1 Tax=Adhaeribacter pallidiroseus TaxID=2072847 RepID=A0A369QN25_9BACT|nr:AraC family transcriptional regulator [Adhaeribacter pallidiroseus]RDC66154.1 hypothetical protein AHMF7616_04785 [Adhaeribacter pallidiroseus]
MTSLQEKASRAFTYSCYHSRNRSGEQFVAEHVFSYQIAGTLAVEDGNQTWFFREGDFRLVRRNHLLKFVKEPPAGGEFKSVSVFLDQETLRDFSIEYGYKAEKSPASNAIISLHANPLLLGFINSLGPYQDLNQSGNENLLHLKRREAILVLLQTNPELQSILFDFSEPGKIDLEAFMHRNFHFNVELKRFAYLTGRSLATFKRDFEKIFHLSPSRWLQQRRLQEAHYLIKEKKKAPSEVYLDLGFEDLSHFSFAFKKMFGVAPTKILQT